MQTYVPEARALRGDGQKRACPTWHGGVAHQPAAYNPVKHIVYGVGTEGCFSQNGAKFAFKSPEGGLDRKASEKRSFSSDLYYGAVTAFDAVNNKVLAKAVTNIEIRSGALDTAGGVLFTALQDGWVVAYDDETLQELWRFNVGTPLKGAPVVYAIGPKEYLAVQASGRHLHPIKYDNLADFELSVRVRAELSTTIRDAIAVASQSLGVWATSGIRCKPRRLRPNMPRIWRGPSAPAR